MVKVVGPLMSLGASGNFRGVMEFRTGSGKSTVTAPRRKPAFRSSAQQEQASAFKMAIEGWNNASESTKTSWKNAAMGTGLTGYQLWITEWFTQNTAPPDEPEIPA